MNKYLEKIASGPSIRLDLQLHKKLRPKNVVTNEIIPFSERKPVSDDDWAYAKILRDSGDHEGAKEHIRKLTHKTEKVDGERFKVHKDGLEWIHGMWTQ